MRKASVAKQADLKDGNTMSTMKSYLLAEKKLVVATLALYTVRSLGQLGSSLITMLLLSAALEGRLDKVLLALACNSGAWVVFSLFDRWSNLLQAKTAARINTALRQNISRNLCAADYENLQSHNMGDYLSWYSNDVDQAEQLGVRNFFTFCFQIINMALSFSALLALHWSLAAVALISSFVMLRGSVFLDRQLKGASQKVSESGEIFTHRLKELLGGLPVFTVFGLKDRFSQGMEQASCQREQVRRDFVRRQEDGSLLVGLMSTATQMVTLLLLFFLCIKRIIPFSAFYGAGNIIAMASNSTQQLGSIRLRLVSAKPYFEKIGKLSQNAEPLPDLPVLEREIRLKDVSFSYPDKPILQNISLTFRKGGKYVIVGPSGCGKTTLLRLIAGQVDGYSGILWFDGLDVRQYAAASRYESIAYIDQQIYLFDGTIRENITLGRQFSAEQLEAVLEESALKSDLVRMPQGLDTQVGEGGKLLSGGQRQRIAIARALLQQRLVLLVDEGTSALDQQNASVIEESLLQNEKLTLIMVSHHLDPQRRQKFDQVIKFDNLNRA